MNNRGLLTQIISARGYAGLFSRQSVFADKTLVNLMINVTILLISLMCLFFKALILDGIYG